jgi:hypothetical protein
MPVTKLFMQNESSFFEYFFNRFSKIVMFYLFSNLRKRGVKMNIKKIFIIC